MIYEFIDTTFPIFELKTIKEVLDRKFIDDIINRLKTIFLNFYDYYRKEDINIIISFLLTDTTFEENTNVEFVFKHEYNYDIHYKKYFYTTYKINSIRKIFEKWMNILKPVIDFCDFNNYETYKHFINNLDIKYQHEKIDYKNYCIIWNVVKNRMLKYDNLINELICIFNIYQTWSYIYNIIKNNQIIFIPISLNSSENKFFNEFKDYFENLDNKIIKDNPIKLNNIKAHFSYILGYIFQSYETIKTLNIDGIVNNYDNDNILKIE